MEYAKLINLLREIQKRFYKDFGIRDIYTNSKFFEILIADRLMHNLIPGHSGSRNGKDDQGEYEYKHYKETSSNHTWTFNDFSDSTMRRLSKIQAVIFAHIDDTGDIPIFDWYYRVPGKIISEYLEKKTVYIKNIRKMINVSRGQIKKEMNIKRESSSKNPRWKYAKYLDEIFDTARKLEIVVGTKNVLTSNKLWEVLVGMKLGHRVLSEQKKFDAIDSKGHYYEYKISITHSFSFEDISEAVLSKFAKVKKILLVVIDKSELKVIHLYEAYPSIVVKRLKEKLYDKEQKYKSQGKEIRRLQVSLSKGDLVKIGAKRIM